MSAATVVEGVISDAATGAVIEGASIFIGIAEGSGRTDAAGNYTVTLERAGSFDLKVFKSGYELLVLEDVVFSEGETLERDLKLNTVGGLGPLTRSVDEELEAIPEGTGSVEGQITESVRGRPLSGVTVTLVSADDAVPVQETTTERGGRYAFSDIATGYYTLRFTYPEHQPATLTDVAIRPDEVTTWDWGLTEIPEDVGGNDVFIMDAFEVSAEVMTQKQFDFQVLRQDAVNMVDLFSAADFAKFAAGDVGEAIQRIPGVTVEGGKFAVIRGLNERYSSTLLNGAPVPSPDPDRQSVPLDLFPSEIVSNLVVSKTFSPSQPGNSSAGSLNIMTNTYPEVFTIKLSVGTGTNTAAQDAYVSGEDRTVLEADLSNLGSNEDIALQAILSEQVTPVFDDVPFDFNYKLEMGGKHLFDDRRELRYYGTFLQEWDYASQTGVENDFFGAAPQIFISLPTSPVSYLIRGNGDYASGELSVSRGTYDFIESSAEKVTSALGSLEFDLTPGGEHVLSYTGFYIDVELDRATIRENGAYPGISEEALLRQDPEEVLVQLAGGFEEFSTLRFWETNMVNETRLLRTHQVGGRHEFGEASPLKINWLGSESTTSQVESHSISASGWRLPDGRFQTGNNTDFSDSFVPTASWRRTQETQGYRRVDAEYSFFWRSFELTPKFGFSRESTSRDISQEFFLYTLAGETIDQSNILTGFQTAEEAVAARFGGVEQNAPESVEVFSNRTANSEYISLTIGLADRFEITPGFRLESFNMTTQNGLGDGDFFNSEFLQNSARFGTALQAERNAAILGLPGPLDPGFEGSIEEDFYLPSLNGSYMINDEFRLLVGFSRTAARPSFKEFTYITTRDPVTLDYTSGNPTLTVSRVTSYDLRLEYTPEGSQDLAAVSFFTKTVQDPIEKVTLFGTVVTDTFFNNPNTADIKGVEIELRKDLSFINQDSLWQYVSVGGNLTYMKAEVDVPQNFRSLLVEGLAATNSSGNSVVIGGGLFATDLGTPQLNDGDFGEAPASRSLFDQPEWIVNADITFDQPDWGTRATLSLFAQSEVLDAAGGLLIGVAPTSAVPDRYRIAYHSLNFTFRQSFREDYYVSFSIKNLTDSTRGIVYDEDLITGSLKNREYTVGRSVSMTVGAEF